ncbi:MAG: type II toxin-antitoxin system HicB family antitoxin [Lachnospiraceae bacterium]|nr:type II toxin-antitoxin system HicB family antitoxin [Lachnospiraceae bacterium]
MKRLFYPALFHKEEDGFWVSFPDFPECFTEGDNLEHAYEMAVDALGLAIVSRREEGQEIPEPTVPSEINAGEGVLIVVNFDMLEYLKKHNSKAVKKTLSIPEWLNEEALRRGLNFSQVLQEALLKKISMQ